MGRAHEVRAASMAKTAAMKSAKYAKWGKEIFQAAKQGLPDPEVNQTLKKVIERAKKDQCTAEVIKRAIEKAKGAISGASKEKVYEGYGNGNVAVIVECLTDNDNRTFSEVRNCFTKTGGQIGQTVSYMFERKAYISFNKQDEDKILEILLENDLDCEEVVTEGELTIVYAEPKYFNDIKDVLEKNIENINFDTCEISLIPTTTVNISGETKEKFERMLEMLQELDDVQDVYHNAIFE